MNQIGGAKYGIYSFNEAGRAHMVEVGEKDDTKRIAIARGKIKMQKKHHRYDKRWLNKKKEMFFQLPR